MRAEIHFKLKEPASIPIQYNHLIQAIIYSWIGDKKFKDFIHNNGYKFKERAYKLFTFSKINGRFHDKTNRRTNKTNNRKGIKVLTYYII